MGCSAGISRHAAARRGRFHGDHPKMCLCMLSSKLGRGTSKNNAPGKRCGTSRHVAARYCFRRGFCSKMRPKNMGLHIVEPPETHKRRKKARKSGVAAGKLGARASPLHRSFGCVSCGCTPRQWTLRTRQLQSCLPSSLQSRPLSRMKGGLQSLLRDLRCRPYG